MSYWLQIHSIMTSKGSTHSESTARVGLENISAKHLAYAQRYSKIQQPQQRHYTSRSITQAMDVQDEHVLNDPNLQTHSIDSQHAQLSVHLPVLRDQRPAIRELLNRPMGGIEKMYNMYSCQGTDIICLMTKVETVYRVTPSAVARALQLLHKRHPLLRMSIKDHENGNLDFVENEQATCDFVVSQRKDWLKFMLEELEYPFNSKSQSLVRYRLLNSTTIENLNEDTKYGVEALNEATAADKNIAKSRNDFSYQATFLFIMHHSIMDGGYSLWMFQDLINFLDAVSMDKDIRQIKELPLLPPFEDIFRFKSAQKQTSETGCQNNYLSFCHNASNDSLLKDYNKAFQYEIDVSPNKKLRNGCLVFKLSKTKTRTFVQMTKSNNCTPKGAVTAACVLSLLELVYDNNFTELARSFTMPIEYMTDFRRVGDFQIPNESVPLYPGVAALHIPFIANLYFDDSKLTADTFWKIAVKFSDSLNKNIDSPEVYEWIRAEAAKYNRCCINRKDLVKSPYVLSISNMGKLDGVLNADISGRVRLTDLHGHSSILVDDMPLFCVTTFVLNGYFSGNVSFCENYTSYQTAERYAGLLQKYLCSFSKL